MVYVKRHRLGILLELFFDATLLLLFMGQAFVVGCILIYGFLPFPSEWGNRIIAKNLPPELIFRVDEFRLSVSGKIDLVGLELRAAHIAQPLLQAEGAEVELDWSLKKPPRADNVVISAGTLYIPSIYSPDGQHSPILDRIAFRLKFDDDHLEVDRFAAIHDTIRLRGSFFLPEHKQTEVVIPIEQWLNKFYTQAAKLAQQKERIRYFKTPTIAFKMKALSAQTQQLDLRISSRFLEHPNVTAERIQLMGSVQIEGSQATPTVSPRLTAKQLDIPSYDFNAQDLSAAITPDQIQALITGKWPRIRLAAQGISVKTFNLDAPILALDASAYPEITFHGATRGLNGAIDLTGQINTESWNGHTRARGSVDLVKLAPKNVFEKMPKLDFKAPPYYDLSLKFNKGLTLKRAKLKAQVDALQVKELTFDHITAHASFEDGFFAIDDLYLRRNTQWLDLKFSLDTNTYDYKVTLIGSAVPYEYNSLLPHWWESIFREFNFGQSSYSLGDFIIYGNTQRRASDLYYGHAEAREVRYKDVLIDQGELIVRGRGPYTELHGLNARSGHGWARGDIAFASKLDHIRGPASIRLDMEAKLTLEDAAKLFSGNVAQIIADFETDTLPVTKLKGVIFNNDYPQYAGKSYFNVTAQCDGPIKFKDVPLDFLSFELYGRTNLTNLRNVQFGYADGQGIAQIDVFTPSEAENTVRYQLELANAVQYKAIQRLPQLDSVEGSLKANSEDGDPRGSGQVDIEIHGEGPIKDPMQHAGFGHFEMRNDQLGAIQLFGPLSRLLQNTYLSFTSFNLNLMRGDFSYEDDLVRFLPLRIDGPRTRITSPGTIRLSDQSLDMRVSVFLFGNAGNPDSGLRKLGNILTKPIPNLLEYELTGTFKNQKLRSLYNPLNLIPGM